MKFNVDQLKVLLKEGSLEVQDGVFLVAETKTLSPTIYMKGEDLLIEFEAPFMYLHITKIGPKKLLNLVKPRVEYVKIGPNSTVVKLSTLGEWEVGED